MIVLLGFRFHLMTELHKIKRTIDWLLDRYNEITNEEEKKTIEVQLERQRRKLEGWYTAHGKG